MAFIQNSAEGGTDGANVTVANSGGASGNPANTVSISAGGTDTIKYSNFRPTHGALGFALNYTAGSTGATRIMWNLGVSEANRFVWTFYVADMVTLPTVTEDLGGIRHSAGNVCIVNIGADGKLILTDAAGAGISASRAPSVFPTGTAVRVEVAATKGTTTTNGKLEYAYYLGNSTTAVYTWSSATVNAGVNNITDVFIGRSTGRAENRTIYYDSVQGQTLASGWNGPFVPVANAPTANAGPDLTSVEPYTTVTINGSQSRDNNTGGTITSYNITQTAGPAVTLSGSGPIWTYEAPSSWTGTALTFSLTVTNNAGVTSPADAATHYILPGVDFLAGNPPTPVRRTQA